MKALLLSLLVACLVSFASTHQQPSPIARADSSIVRYLKSVAHDPASYQYISTSFIDSLKTSQILEEYIPKYQKLVSDNEQIINSRRAITKEAKAVKAKMEKTLDIAREFITVAQPRLDSIKSGKRRDLVERLLFLHTFRMKNAVGALNRYTFEVTLDTNLNVFEVEERK